MKDDQIKKLIVARIDSIEDLKARFEATNQEAKASAFLIIISKGPWDFELTRFHEFDINCIDDELFIDCAIDIGNEVYYAINWNLKPIETESGEYIKPVYPPNCPIIS